MIKNKKILVLSSITTYPVNTGWWIRSHFIIKELAKYNQVNVFVPIARKSDFPKWITFWVDCWNYTETRYINYFLQWCTFILEKFGLFWISFILLKFILKRNKFVQTQIQNADIIFLNFPHLWFLIPKENKKEIYYISHNVEYDLLKQNSKISFQKLNNFFIEKLKNEEKILIEKSNKTFVCTQNDIEKYTNDLQIWKEKFSILENGVDRNKIDLVEEYPEIYKDKKNKVIFVWSQFGPNIEAMHIIESLAKLYPDFNFFIAGTVAKWKKSQWNIFFLPDWNPVKINTLIKYANYAINSVVSGSGSNLKMIDYFIFWIPTVTTVKWIRWFEKYTNILLDENNLSSFEKVIKNIDENKDFYINKWTEIAKKYFWEDLVYNKIINEK